MMIDRYEFKITHELAKGIIVMINPGYFHVLIIQIPFLLLL